MQAARLQICPDDKHVQLVLRVSGQPSQEACNAASAKQVTQHVLQHSIAGSWQRTGHDLKQLAKQLQADTLLHCKQPMRRTIG